jgi:hypothetical protein
MEAVILIGVQGSGKSTFCKQRFYDTQIDIFISMIKNYLGVGLIAAFFAGALAFVFVPMITGYPEWKQDNRDLKLTLIIAILGFIIGVILEYSRSRKR